MSVRDRLLGVLLGLALGLALLFFMNMVTGTVYESYLFRKNAIGFVDDVKTLIEDPDRELPCVDVYNPFRWWVSYEDQTRRVVRRCPKNLEEKNK